MYCSFTDHRILERYSPGPPTIIEGKDWIRFQDIHFGFDEFVLAENEPIFLDCSENIFFDRCMFDIPKDHDVLFSVKNRSRLKIDMCLFEGTDCNRCNIRIILYRNMEQQASICNSRFQEIGLNTYNIEEETENLLTIRWASDYPNPLLLSNACQITYDKELIMNPTTFRQMLDPLKVSAYNIRPSTVIEGNKQIAWEF